MYKILIADDDPRIREILRVYFKKADFEVIEAEDGQQALTKVCLLYTSPSPRDA